LLSGEAPLRPPATESAGAMGMASMHRQGLACVLGVIAAAGVVALAHARPLDVVQPVAFLDDAYYYQGDEFLVSGPEPSTSGSSADVDPSRGASDACCDPCADCGDGCDCGSGCGAGGIVGAIEAISLAGLLGLADDSPLVIGGWSQWGYHNESDGVFNTYPDHFQAQQQYLYAGWTADGSAGLGLGGRVDVVYGTDAQNTQAFGNNPGEWDFRNGYDHGVYGWALPQAYAEVAAGDLSVKVGHFYTLLGYQVVPATGNFFYSIPYTFNFSEAFTHTGALGAYTMSDTVTLYGGWTLGWDTGFDQLAGGNSFIGGAAVTLMDALTVTMISTGGDLGWIGDDGYTHSIVGVLDITDAFQYVFQSDLVDVDNSPASDGGRYDTFGINQYLFYTFNDILKGGARMEWWKADGQSVYEMAYGMNVRPASNLVFRPEIRYNWSPNDTLPFVLSSLGTDATYINEWIAACDVILSF
jgi:hypothetical protein